jgi:hypothetical protein
LDDGESAAAAVTDGWARRAAIVGTIAAAGVAILLLRIPLCPLATIAHVPCPGCGLTRATLALVHGDVSAALGLHPLAPVLSPFVAAFALANAYTYVRHARLASLEGALDRWTTRGAAALIVLLLGVWIARFFGAFGGPVAV